MTDPTEMMLRIGMTCVVIGVIVASVAMLYGMWGPK